MLRSEPASVRGSLPIVALVLRVALGAVFLFAAWSKLQQPWALFAMTIDSYGIFPEAGAVFIARSLPWVELALGLLLISGKFARIAASAASLLLLVFFALLVRSYVKGMQIDCGCFGIGEALTLRTLARDAILLIASLSLTAIAFGRAIFRRAGLVTPANGH